MTADPTKVLVQFRYIQRKFNEMVRTLATEGLGTDNPRVVEPLLEMVERFRRQLDVIESGLRDGTLDDAVGKILDNDE